MFYVKLAITLSAIAFIFTRQPIAELWAAVRELSPVAFVLATCLQYVAVAVRPSAKPDSFAENALNEAAGAAGPEARLGRRS